MPNPRAQKPLTLELVKKDLMTFKEPFMALADQAAGGMRGLTLGTFGLPGEIESLSRSAINAMLQTASPRATASRGKDAPQISDKTFLPTMDELSKRWSPTIPEGVPNQKSRERSADFGETFGKFGVLPGTTGLYGGVYRGVKSIPAAFKHGALEFAKAAGQPSTNIVKSGGGNWLRQGLDEQRSLGDAGRGRAMQGWNRQPPEHQAQFPERQLGAVADDTVADWANNNMLKYMANQMGTKNDPVRKLAEQNISHFGMRPDEFGEFPFVKPSDQTKKLRKQHTERTGEDSSMADSSLAMHWENSSDNAIKATTVGDIKNAPNFYGSLKAKEDIASYVDKVSPETPIYNIDTGDNYMTARGSLGFNRMMGVMRDDIAAGRITPEEVAKWDMEQAVRHVDKRDKAIWKAEAEEADRLAKEFAKYFPTLKEYPDKSRWIELKVPDLNSLPKEERLQLIDKLTKEAREQGINPEQYIEDYPRMKLEEALAHEGEKMGHCVGSYCDDVVSGKSRVISYRDANGDSHVTLEVTPPDAGRYPISEEAFKALPSTQQIEYSHAVRQWRQRNPDVEELTNANISKALEEAGFQPRPDEIKQIKGKQDARPVDRYIPYVQDFQRTTNYPIEGDFGNSGFIKHPSGTYYTEGEAKSLYNKHFGDVETGESPTVYYNRLSRYEPDMLTDLDKAFLEDYKAGNFPKPEDGMKAGGAVHISDNPDTMAMELQNQHYQAGGVVRGLKALKGALRNPEALVPSARGATKFADTEPKTMSVIKEKGGNWLGGEMSGATVGNVDKALKRFKTTTVAGQTPAERIPLHERALLDPAINDDGRAIIQRHLDVTKGEAAIDKWIENNIGNYIKKDMATPTDPVRLMLEKRAQEIEAQFQVDMNRAERTRARAEAETDPRRQANLMRQASQQEEQAKFDRDFANEHVTHLPKDEWAGLSNPSEELMQKRNQEGFQMLGEAKSDPAQRWENLTDDAVGVNRAGDIQAQKDAMTKAQDAERAFLTKDDEINETFRPRLIETLAQRGEKLSDKDIDALVKNLPNDQKAAILGEGETWNALRNESQQARINVNSGLYGAYSENKWVDKLDPEANVYSAYIGDLGLDHVIDVIRQDVAAGRIRPEQLNKLSMDQAIQRTAEFNMEQAKKMRETAIRQTEGMPVYKDYGDEGYKWIELAAPKKDLPSGWSVKEALNPMSGKQFQVFDESGAPIAGAYGKTEESAISSATKQLGRPELESALKYEGDTMGHCVGGYCPDVLEGRSRIYSLRDARGEPHVTVEVQPMRGSELGRYAADLPEGADVEAMKNPPLMIRQIKGKGNARPIQKYDPYTQDFVKSGQWQHVGDLENTGLHKLGSEYFTLPEAEAKFKPKIQEALNFLETHPSLEEHRLAQKADDAYRGDVFGPEYDKLNRAAGRSITPNVPYTYRELKALLTSPEDWTDRGETIYTPISRALDKISEARKELGIIDEPPIEGMKAGGRVNFSNNPDSMQMELQDQRYQVGGVVRGLSKASKGAAKNAGKEATKSAVKVANEPSISKAPSIIIPSKLSNVKEAIRQSKGNYGAKRVERAADEIPNLERLYKEEALRQAFEGDNAKPLMTMNPADFEKYAMGLPTRTITEPKSFGDKTRMSTEDYLKYLRTLPEGFDDVPFLEINKQEQGLPLMPFISGHEGRHRNRAMAESGEQSGLVRLFPRAELREGFPRKSQEEYIEALKKELEMTGNLVLPEHNRYNPTDVQRPAIDMPDIYAKGGKVHVSDNSDAMQMELDNKKFAMGGAVEGDNDVGSPSPQNSASPVPSYQAGGVVKGLTALKQALTGGSAEAAKAARVAALRQSGLSVAEAKARVELAEQAAEMKQALKASEALARIEGKHLNITQADRTKVGEGYLGGPGFSGLQMKEGPHKDVGAVWGVKNTGTAKTMLGGFDKPLGNEYFTTMIGSPTQHQSNQMVFDKLYKDFTAQAKKGNLDSNLRKQINDRLASAVDKDGNAIFPPNIDILSKNFKKQASTFDQRAVVGNVLGGVGIGGKKGQIIDYEKIIRDTTDPFLLDTPSGDLGYRIWTPSGEIIERPDLHPAFPTIATGEDLGVEFAPADKNVLLAPFLEKFRAEKGRDPGYMDMTRGRPARVQITEPLLKNLQESGNKAGGAVKAKNKYSDGGAISALMKHAETAGQSARMNNQRM